MPLLFKVAEAKGATRYCPLNADSTLHIGACLLDQSASGSGRFVLVLPREKPGNKMRVFVGFLFCFLEEKLGYSLTGIDSLTISERAVCVCVCRTGRQTDAAPGLYT